MRRFLATDNILHKAKISDAGALVSEGLVAMSVKDAQEYLRAGALAGATDYIGEGFLARVIKSTEDGRRRVIKITTKITEVSILESMVDELLRKCFFKSNCHKLSILLTVEDALLEEAITSLGFIQEALLTDEIVRIKDGVRTYSDAGLFSIKRAEYSRYNTCFVPFQRGVVAVTGGVDYVDSVTFLSYGKAIEDEFVFECAWYQGITDDNGIIYSRNEYPFEVTATDFEFMPAELIRAYDELKEYFHKTRDSFDINVRINSGTEFQLSVWTALKRIPYGVTKSYEDIALELTGNDLKQARKLTRAVGKACSENPVPIIIPCHRVIGKNGMLVGFSGGIEFKDFLLQNELFASALPLN